jgi:LPXTG-site transpeptidase (sortase) family protein
MVERPVIPNPTPSASAEPSSIPTVIPLSLQEMAWQTYGKRLITQIRIPAIAVDAPMVAVGWRVDRSSNPAGLAEWDSPGPAVGWVVSSALPGQNGNIILYGHNNMYGSVFRNLWKLGPGEAIVLQTGEHAWQYQVDRVVLLPFLQADEGQRLAYQAYLTDSALPRLTIISCWPPESNTHRVVVIAYPVIVP